MKKLVSTIVIIACLVMTYDANAAGTATCSRSTTPPSGMAGNTASTVPGCTGTTTWYYITYNSGGAMADLYGSCSACGTGYERQQIQASTSSGVYNICSNYSSMVSGLYTCVAKTCTDCTSDTSWSSSGTTGYQKKTTATCNAGVCTKTTAYRCAAGYYGSSTNGTSGCTQCPTWSGVYTDSARTKLVRGYSDAGATAITNCFIIPAGLHDVAGNFNLTSTCPYINNS